jgi:hypothetical protein
MRDEREKVSYSHTIVVNHTGARTSAIVDGEMLVGLVAAAAVGAVPLGLVG